MEANGNRDVTNHMATDLGPVRATQRKKKKKKNIRSIELILSTGHCQSRQSGYHIIRNKRYLSNRPNPCIIIIDIITIINSGNVATSPVSIKTCCPNSKNVTHFNIGGGGAKPV